VNVEELSPSYDFLIPEQNDPFLTPVEDLPPCELVSFLGIWVVVLYDSDPPLLRCLPPELNIAPFLGQDYPLCILLFNPFPFLNFLPPQRPAQEPSRVKKRTSFLSSPYFVNLT